MKKRELLNLNVPLSLVSALEMISKMSGLPKSRVIALALLDMECMIQTKGLESYWEMVHMYQEEENVKKRHITCSVPRTILHEFVDLCKDLESPKNVVANVALFNFITNADISALKNSCVQSCYGTKYLIRVDKIFRFFKEPVPQDWNNFLQEITKNVSNADKLTYFCAKEYLSIYVAKQRNLAATLFFTYEYVIHSKYQCLFPYTKHIREV